MDITSINSSADALGWTEGENAMEILRQEILETQKARSELIKWKLVLVAGLGAIGLGFAESEADLNAEVLLCCIPFVCLYVDAQYANLSLRIHGIATFFLEVGPKVDIAPAMIEYEGLMAFSRKNVRRELGKTGKHAFQGWLVRISSYVFCGFVAVFGLAILFNRFAVRNSGSSIWLAVSMTATGVLGLGLIWLLFSHHDKCVKTFRESGKQYWLSTRTESGQKLRFIQVRVTNTPYWEFVTRTTSTQGVTIMAVTQDKSVVLVKQHRVPLDTKVIELPAGLVGDKNADETPEHTVAKELLEETGYSVEPAKIRLLAEGPALAGLTDEVNAMYLATDVTQVSSGGGNKDEGEEIETLTLPLANAYQQLEKLKTDDCMVDLKVYAGLFLLLQAFPSSSEPAH